MRREVMKIEAKKKAIIMAAVSAYLEERNALATGRRPEVEPEHTAWGMSGRQETMQMAMLIQRRMWQHA